MIKVEEIIPIVWHHHNVTREGFCYVTVIRGITILIYSLTASVEF